MAKKKNLATLIENLKTPSDKRGATHSSKKYYPYLDGLRAVSIFFVIAYHAWLPLFKSGSIGVDVFFIISGFLITSLLLKELAVTGAISLKKFYIRRVCRILPGLVTLLMVGTVLQRYWMPEFLGPDPTNSLLAGWGMFIDIFNFRGHSAEAFNHLWSVHLEEQFYLFWSVLLVVLLRFKRMRSAALEVFLLTFVFGGFALRLGLDRFLAEGHSATALRFLVSKRVDHLFLGCFFGYLVAVPSTTAVVRWCGDFLKKPCHGLNTGLSLLILFGAQLPELDNSGMFYFCISISTAILIFRLRDEAPSRLKSLLSSNAFVYVGKRSYSLYLWHWPMQEFVIRLGLHGPLKIGSYILLTVVAAELSYNLIERPFLRLKELYFEPKTASELRESRAMSYQTK